MSAAAVELEVHVFEKEGGTEKKDKLTWAASVFAPPPVPSSPVLVPLRRACSRLVRLVVSRATRLAEPAPFQQPPPLRATPRQHSEGKWRLGV